MAIYVFKVNRYSIGEANTVQIVLSISLVNKRTQELIQSDSHQAQNTNGKDRQIQQKQSQNEQMASRVGIISQKGWNSVTQN